MIQGEKDKGGPLFLLNKILSRTNWPKTLRALSKRILGYLVRKGIFEKSEMLRNDDPFADRELVLAACMAASIQYRIGFGPRAGQKVRRLGTKAIEAILSHLRLPTSPPVISPARAPPQEEWNF